jgi:hypothetical protein
MREIERRHLNFFLLINIETYCMVFVIPWDDETIGISHCIQMTVTKERMIRATSRASSSNQKDCVQNIL